jgi:hypothetical protein
MTTKLVKEDFKKEVLDYLNRSAVEKRLRRSNAYKTWQFLKTCQT